MLTIDIASPTPDAGLSISVYSADGQWLSTGGLSGDISSASQTGVVAEQVYFLRVEEAAGIDSLFELVLTLNKPPVLQPIEDVTGLGGRLNVQAEAADPDGDNLTFSLDLDAPAGAEIDPRTGLFSWTPAADQGPGEYFITVIVTDDGPGSLSDRQTFRVVQVNPLTPWRNPADPLDVNDDNFVSPQDVLAIINHINSNDVGPVPVPPEPPNVPPPYVDVSGDNHVSPVDALLVINFLNEQSSAEGEFVGPPREDRSIDGAGESSPIPDSLSSSPWKLPQRTADNPDLPVAQPDMALRNAGTEQALFTPGQQRDPIRAVDDVLVGWGDEDRHLELDEFGIEAQLAISR